MNKTTQRTLSLLLAALLTLCCSSALAVAAYPGKISFTEPATDIAVPVYNRGDEHFSYMTDTSGNLLVVDESGCLRWVVENGGAYALGGSVTGQAVSPAASGKTVTASSLSRERLEALLSQVAANRPSTYAYTTPEIPLDYQFEGDRAKGRVYVCTTDAEDEALADVSRYPPKLSTCPLLVLKLQFNDIKCKFSDEQWHNRIFEGGVTQYYQTVSNGKFTYTPAKETGGKADDGIVTVTLPFDCPRFALVDQRNNQLTQNDPIAGLYRGTDNYNYAVYNMGSLFAYALLAAEDKVDFDSYDRNDDGFLCPTELAVLVIFSGYETAIGGADAAVGQPGVWAHSWLYNNCLSNRLAPSHYMTIQVDHMRMSKYTVIGELANFVGADGSQNGYLYPTGSEPEKGIARQAQFGTICHELGHDLGLTDLYATGESNTSQRVEGLSLMGTGNWGAVPYGEQCSSPTHMDPLSKIRLGFYDAVTTDTAGKFTLYASEPASQYNILRVNTADPNVYYLIENRQYTGYDLGLRTFYDAPQGGLVLWRVDQAVVDSKWQLNTVNNEEGHYGLMPVFLTQLTDPDRESFQPFWSVASHPSTTLLQSAPRLAFSALSQPGHSMTLNISPEEIVVVPAAGGSEKAVNVPVTGDRFQPALWLALGLGALAGAAALCLTGRRKRARAQK